MKGELIFFFQLVASGIAVGCLYALIGVGFVLIFKATGILNFAQGEIMMGSAFVCYFLIVIFHLPFLAAFLISCIIAALIGIVTERLVLRRMIGEPIFAVVMVTIGLSIFLRSVIAICFSVENVVMPSPFPKVTVNMIGVILSHAQVWIVLMTTGLFILFFLFFKYSRLGLAMRGTAEDQMIASLMGVGIKRIFAMIWSVSFVTAAISGVFLANIMVLNIAFSSVIISAFPAMILGGLESIPGVIIGGLIIGVVENLAGGYLEQVIGSGIKDVTPFVFLFLTLMIKPYGLFGKEEVERV